MLALSLLSSSPERRWVLLMGVSLEGSLALLAWLLGWLWDVSPWESLRFSMSDAVLGGAASLPMLLAGIVCARWPRGPLRRIQQIFDEIFLPLLRPCTIPDLTMLALTAGIGEELLFRGVLQVYFHRWMPTWLALASASLFFGFAHAITWTYVLLATLAGMYLGFIWLLTGNLLVTIVAHAVYDLIMLVYLLRRPATRLPLPSAIEEPNL